MDLWLKYNDALTEISTVAIGKHFLGGIIREARSCEGWSKAAPAAKQYPDPCNET